MDPVRVDRLVWETQESRGGREPRSPVSKGETNNLYMVVTRVVGKVDFVRDPREGRGRNQPGNRQEGPGR